MSHQERVDAGVSFDWKALPTHRTTLDGLATDAEELRFRREGSSHRNISRFRKLKKLWLYSVNQDFLNLLADLPSVEVLFIDGLTATDLTPLTKLPRLRQLILNGGTKVESLDWVADLPPLQAFAIENFKRVSVLDPIASLTSLTALGVEGSIWTPMRVASLAPVSQLQNLRHLFITNLRTTDQSLRHLHPLSRLEELQSGALFPDDEFVQLRRALPTLKCQWFDMIETYGSTREGIRITVHGK